MCRRFTLSIFVLVLIGGTAARAQTVAEWNAALDEAAASYQAHQYEDAIMSGEKAMQMARSLFKPGKGDYLNLATTLNDLAIMYKKAGVGQKAEPLYKESLEITQQLMGADHPEALITLNNLALLYKQMGRYEEAEPIYKDALVKIGAKRGTEDSLYVSIEGNLANLYAEVGRYGEAEPLYESAVRDAKAVYGVGSQPHAEALLRLGSLFEQMGRYSEAGHLYSEAAGYYEKFKGESGMAYAKALNNLGLLYKETGEYAKAEMSYQKSIELHDKILGSRHLETATVQNNLAALYEAMGRYKDAEALYKTSLEVKRYNIGEEDPTYATTLNNLASLYFKMERYAEAQVNYEKAAEIKRATLGELHRDYAIALNNRAALHSTIKEYAEAERLYLKALEVHRRTVGEQHPDFAATLNNLGALEEERGNLDKADKLYTQALTIKKNVLGVDHPSYAQSLLNQARLRHKQGKELEAERLYLEANAHLLQQIETYFPALSEREKAAFYRTTRQGFEQFNSFALRRQERNPSILGEMYNNQLATKALLLNSSARIRRRIMESKDKELIAEYQRWLDLREYLANLYTLSKEDVKRAGVNLQELEAEANQLEKDLSLRSEVFAERSGNKNVTWQQVQATLKPGEAAVEIIRLERYEKIWTGKIQYVALILTPQTKDHPELVLLENGDDLENKYIKFYQNTIRFREPDNVSYTEYWAKIRRKLGGAGTVYVSPDGIYNVINLNTLKNPLTEEYVIDELDIHVVNNTRDLVEEPLRRKGKRDVVLIGAPDFNYRVAGTAGQQSQLQANLRESLMQVFAGGNIKDLPGTQKELNQIAELLGAARRTKLASYQGREATEGRIKGLSEPQVLHIATHGYFLSDVLLEKQKALFGLENVESRQLAENPLLRSGLLLTGASPTIKGQPLYGEDDGILTASEAMSLELEGTELVVLSACETGLGEIKNGEGVFGLNRAFQVAGAQRTLISLWGVEDEATQKLMTNLYAAWIEVGDMREAFKIAQQKLRKENPEPYYWGAFQLIGR